MNKSIFNLYDYSDSEIYQFIKDLNLSIKQHSPYMVTYSSEPSKMQDKLDCLSVGVGFSPTGAQMNTQVNRQMLKNNIANMVTSMDIPDCILINKYLYAMYLSEDHMRTTIINGYETHSLYDMPLVNFWNYIPFNESSPEERYNTDCASVYLIKYKHGLILTCCSFYLNKSI